MPKIYFETVGCSANVADSEQMAGLLQKAQFEIVNNLEDADVIILNSCMVKGPTETAFHRRLKQIGKEHPYKVVVISGCIAQTDPKKLKRYPLIGTKQIHKIVEVVEEAINDNIIHLLETDEMPPLNLPRVRKNPIISIIPISRGYLGVCSFCKTKSARGNLKSYSLADIKKEAETAIQEGVKEIWITSQDTGCYGFDIGTNLPALLRELVGIPGKFKIRVGMMNPDHLLKIRSELIEVFKSPKLFQFIHLPIQSGNNDILKSMKRNYTRENFIFLVKELREVFPLITIMTDVIIGFPGETEGQYWDTLNVIRETFPDAVNISRYWPRPGTPAAKLKQLPGEIVKHRSRVLTDICHNVFKMQNERWLDWKGVIIIDEKTNYPEHPDQWVGRNTSYKPVIVEGEFKMGQVVKVTIEKANTFDLHGIAFIK